MFNTELIMTEETVSPQEAEAETVVQEMQQDAQEIDESQEQDVQESQEEKQVPLSALQKERKKRQELEAQIEYARQMQTKPSEEDDLSRYESATREDLGKTQQETVRLVEERLWVRQNQERYDYVNEYLPEFLKQRPHLAHAINEAPNRYEEAWTLINALSPRQKQQLNSPKREQKPAPNSPSAVPKSAGIDQAVDIMSMTDTEYFEWRKAQKRKR